MLVFRANGGLVNISVEIFALQVQIVFPVCYFHCVQADNSDNLSKRDIDLWPGHTGLATVLRQNKSNSTTLPQWFGTNDHPIAVCGHTKFISHCYRCIFAMTTSKCKANIQQKHCDVPQIYYEGNAITAYFAKLQRNHSKCTAHCSHDMHTRNT